MRNGLKFALGVVIGAGAASAIYAGKVGRQQVQLDRYVVPVEKKGLPPAGLVILHLTDFHFKADGAIQARKLTELRRLLQNESYDILVATGDLIHDTGGLPPAIQLLTALKPELGAYFVPGNHDYTEYTMWGSLNNKWREGQQGAVTLDGIREFAKALGKFIRQVATNEMVREPVCFHDVPAMLRELQAAGIVTLVNRSTRVELPDGEVWLAGVDDEMESHPDLSAALAGVPEDAPLVLLAHNPDIWLEPDAERADLILSGHTHGGQIQFPVMGAIHTQGTHLPRSRPAGWFERGRSRMFVGRGLGESIPLRFGARPQVALIRLIGMRNGSEDTEGTDALD